MNFDKKLHYLSRLALYEKIQADIRKNKRRRRRWRRRRKLAHRPRLRSVISRVKLDCRAAQRKSGRVTKSERSEHAVKEFGKAKLGEENVIYIISARTHIMSCPKDVQTGR